MSTPKIFKLSICLLLVLANSLVGAQDERDNITSSSYGDWFVRCETIEKLPPSCVMSQQALTQAGERQLFQINIAKVEQGVLMTAIFPLGIYLPAGVDLQVDDFEKTHFAFDFCTQEGCFVNQLLADEIVQLLRKKLSAKFTIALSKGSSVHIPMSITGFLGAFAEL